VAEKLGKSDPVAYARREVMRSAAHGQAWREHAAAAPVRKAARVFISYAQQDRSVARALAAFLVGEGIECWWDREIQSGEDFTCAIETALVASDAVVVIWSEVSVGKEYVRNEATYARNRGKLITVHVPGFDKEKIPIGFILRQSECVADRVRLIEALGRFEIYPRAQITTRRKRAT
jgi:hypothetical protein